MTYKIRPITEQDIEVVAVIYRDGMAATPYCREMTEEIAVQQIMFNMESSTLLVAEKDEKIRGFISGFKFFDNEWLIWVMELFVAEEARGHGVGDALLAAIKAEYPECERVELITHKDAEAMKFYAKEGFVETGYVHLMQK